MLLRQYLLDERKIFVKVFKMIKSKRGNKGGKKEERMRMIRRRMMMMRTKTWRRTTMVN